MISNNRVKLVFACFQDWLAQHFAYGVNGDINATKALLCLLEEQADILWLCQIAFDGYRLRPSSPMACTVCSASCSGDGLW